MGETERFSIVWKESDGRLAERFYVPGFDGFLPFMISGDELSRLESQEEIELTEWQLLSGILYALDEFDNQPKFFHRPKDRETLTYLLDVLGKGFSFDDPEDLVLDVAAKLRERNGNGVSRTVLQVGFRFLPFSSKLRSDLICDTWAVASERNDVSLLDEVPDIVSETNLDGILPRAREVICYYGLCALVLLGRYDEIERYLEEFVYPNVSNSKLKIGIKDLLEAPDKFSPRELELK